jgi:hypothetical protein
MWCGQWGTRAKVSRLQQEAKAWSPQAAFVFCIATMVLAVMFDVVGQLFEGTKQLCIAASRVQWVGIFVLTYVCTVQRRGSKYLLFVVCVEVIKGFTGFFSDFKEVFIVVLLGMLAARPKLDIRSIMAACAVCSVVVTLGIFWSAIKTQYRDFISQGTREQVVIVSLEDRLGYLSDSIRDVDLDMMSRGLDSLLRRVGYVDFLSATLRNVPSHVPFQNGSQIGATILHVLQPRLLFPDKPPLMSDTEVVEKYAGVHFGKSSGEGTSVSLGYLAELYIDFGVLGALGVMFCFGAIIGCAVKFLLSSRSLPSIANAGFAVMLVISVMQFEVALVKIVGTFVTTFITIVGLRRFAFPILLGVLGRNNNLVAMEPSR